MEADQKQQALLKQYEKQSSQLNPTQNIMFDWTNRWLKGHQYAHILKNIHAYSKKYGFLIFQYKTHPLSIYEYPINGMIYFVKGNGVGSDFGFPRVAKKKRYRWKKMNFTTDLPKQSPHVTYVVASAMKSKQIQDEIEIPNFRMHAVIPHKNRLHQYVNPPEYILCHVRKVDKKSEEQDIELKQCFKDNQVDFYKLFAYMQNLNLKAQQQ